jgi:hypothetical protein
MDDQFDSPQAIRSMRKRQAELGFAMQKIGMQALIELRDRGQITAEECSDLLAKGLDLERSTDPKASRKRH